MLSSMWPSVAIAVEDGNAAVGGEVAGKLVNETHLLCPWEDRAKGWLPMSSSIPSHTTEDDYPRCVASNEDGTGNRFH